MIIYFLKESLKSYRFNMKLYYVHYRCMRATNPKYSQVLFEPDDLPYSDCSSLVANYRSKTIPLLTGESVLCELLQGLPPLYGRPSIVSGSKHQFKTSAFCIAMASSAMITVPTTASRFALLQIDSDSDSDASEPGKTSTKSGRDSSGKLRQGKAAGGKGAQGSDKKKDKKKKKKEQQQSEANELRNLAFKKIPQKSCAPPPCMTLSGIASELLTPAPGDHNTQPEGWQQWKQRDEQITTELYEADLEKALILSKLEYEQQKQNSTSTSSPKSRVGKEGGGKKDKKKNQQTKDKKTVSLQDFQAEGSADVSRKQEKEEVRAVNAALGIVQDERFFNKLEDDVTQIIQREKRREQYANGQGQEVNTSTEHEPDPRAEQLKYELEKKDQEIDKLKKTISQWEVKYKEVKARNAQLLKMLQQGEMKDKAEILLQVEELLHIKEELSSQVTLLHAALEQERSKVKGLQSEQPKHQGNKRGKKGSEADL